MFIIASGGRCGTHAICHGLNQFSNHVVRHEPEPRLLREAYLKHQRQPHDTAVLQARLRFFEEQAQQSYGESVRAPNLLPEIQTVAPQTRFLIIVRNPLEYVLSAHSKRVFSKGDMWDETRIIPLDLRSRFADLPISQKIAWHWVAVNSYLLDFAESASASTKVVVLRNLEVDLPQWAVFLGVAIRDADGLAKFLKGRPNAATRSDLPHGYDENRLTEICSTEWSRAQALSQ